ncbi:AAA domain-containing protein [Streptosporangium subroseum]|uniref:AAA domain-containing protein n=1 Tax=Streptosporangium subroseum TaxID=106412 RepID=A0A239N3N4_9ACTN|nr:DEAD/DEAH box helicase [Streptosporangium subroseum]SNT48788.1 AAA domain-containing protein [Streptosporangium subroseum]
MTAIDESRAQILEFWRACELFNPQSIPKVDPADAREPVFSIEPGQPLPWQVGHPLRNRQLKPNLAWRHILYGGIFSLQKSRDLLRRVFGPDLENPDPPPPGLSSLFAVVITDEGRPLLSSFQVSSGAWATGRTNAPGPTAKDWLTGFDEEHLDFCERLEALVAARQDDERAAELRKLGYRAGRPVGHAELVRLVELATGLLGVGDILDPQGVQVKSVRVSRKREHAVGEGVDLLNSFVARDLSLVANFVRIGEYGTALDDYLSTDQLDRIDIRHELQAVFYQVAPARVPLGRWPARPDKSLALSQQFAVNTIMDELATCGGLFAVNGPPGTGKTTMLRDLIAANVVERALRLSRLSKPAAAFTDEYRWKVKEYTRLVTGWSEDLTGFEMVMTSANNGAVENVTNEIPSKNALDSPWRETAAYFNEIATAVLGQPAWGLVAARLGRKSNRAEFVRDAWYGSADQPGLLQQLREWENKDVDWEEAVASFLRAHQRVLLLQEERSAAYDALQELPELQQFVARVELDIEETERRIAQAQTILAKATQRVEAATQTMETWEVRQLEHRRLRPVSTSPDGASDPEAREWRTEELALVDRTRQAMWKMFAARRQVADIRKHIDTLKRAFVESRRELDQALTRIGELRSLLARHQEELDTFFPKEPSEINEALRELKTPWTDEVWNTARSELFLEALRLHHAFLRAEAPRIRRSLQGMMDVLSGDVPPDVPEAAVRAAWQTLFFVIPVISTTFASFGWMFSHLTRESLGWVFIDEAGQAAPQLAVGAIWRARRVITSGDPLQLEPVVPLSAATQQALRRTFSVEHARWLPGRTSVQQLADQRTPYGTFLPGEEAPVWVGAPLRVHRRCDQPMFDISNAIAYGGLMVYGKPQLPDFGMPHSKWIDVPGTNSKGHWIPDEGVVLERIVRYLIEQGGIPHGNILVISPFRDVVKELRWVLRPFPGMRYGTVHTAQGKEADVVIVILGGDPQRPGAKRWAASRPNLLNVAVSRAKRRLYVIGDRAAWSQERYFDVLASRLFATDSAGRGVVRSREPEIDDHRDVPTRLQGPTTMPTQALK